MRQEWLGVSAEGKGWDGMRWDGMGWDAKIVFMSFCWVEVWMGLERVGYEKD